MMAYIPPTAIHRMITDLGAERVSNDAAKALVEILEKNATKLIKDAILMAEVAGRKTVKRSDFEHALKYINK